MEDKIEISKHKQETKNIQSNLNPLFHYNTQGFFDRKSGLVILKNRLEDFIQDLDNCAEEIMTTCYQAYKLCVPSITEKNIEDYYKRLLETYSKDEKLDYIEFLRYQSKAGEHLISKGKFASLLHISRQGNPFALSLLCQHIGKLFTQKKKTELEDFKKNLPLENEYLADKWLTIVLAEKPQTALELIKLINFEAQNEISSFILASAVSKLAVFIKLYQFPINASVSYDQSLIPNPEKLKDMLLTVHSNAEKGCSFSSHLLFRLYKDGFTHEKIELIKKDPKPLQILLKQAILQGHIFYSDSALDALCDNLEGLRDFMSRIYSQPEMREVFNREKLFDRQSDSLEKLQLFINLIDEKKANPKNPEAILLLKIKGEKFTSNLQNNNNNN